MSRRGISMSNESAGQRVSRYGDLYTDRNGDRYTTAVMGADGDPWQGATILTQRVVDRLRADDLLPLTEVVHWEPVVKARANVVQAFLRWLNTSVLPPAEKGRVDG